MANTESLQPDELPGNVYNTTIKDIAGLKDYRQIFNIVNVHFAQPDSTESRITDDNEFDIRTIKTRSKVNWAIQKTVLHFINADHEALASSVFQEHIPDQDRKFAFFWHLCLNNRLFREITTRVFVKTYFSGRAQISQEDIIAFVKDISDKNDPSKPSWSEDTLYRVATKYLSLMTKFDFVTSGRTKTFNHIRPSSEALTLFLYFARLYQPAVANILKSRLLPTCFITAEDIQSRLKKLSIQGFFHMSFNGVELNVELTHSYKEVCDVLYR
ncbi:BrxA family protein [Endozoicomonas sp. GU-1]|uniref:BrxA family protein n=1 Tax=Endozoicomonas sp. GU-1 TaxID=3009078 RepID=UPI0022B59365|nr:BrxA family protein [Endozoicomonas sp. GU-1]WBA82838.1 DUF1819 family protein [Endozoicomonas sp. GU-1]WBA85766.1 DUF1819 family protein [Endozoicomonas sp. GU-1]